MRVEACPLVVWLRLHLRPLARALFPGQAKTKERGVDVRGGHHEQRRAYRVEVCGYRGRLRQEKSECCSRTGAARQEELEEEALEEHRDWGRMDWARRSCAGIPEDGSVRNCSLVTVVEDDSLARGYLYRPVASPMPCIRYG